MKILQINSHYDQGGAARIVACIHRQLLLQGVESFVAYGRGKETDSSEIYRFDRLYEIYFSALVSRIVGINGWSNWAATKRLIDFIERVQPDVIHLHALHGYYLNFSLLFKYINKHDIPCIWTFHDCHAFVGNCGYFFECTKWKEECKKCPHIQNYPKSQFFDFTSFMWKKKKSLFTKGNKKIIVTPSEWLTTEAKHSFFGKYPCITIRNGIDTEKIYYPRGKQECRKKYGYSPEDKLVLGIAVGFSDPRKGVKYVVQMAKDLSREVKVILIGWDQRNDHMLTGTENITALSAILDTNILAEYYSMADVFVLPSLAENYATVSLEAMACGTPVVGFDVGGIPEQLADGKGVVVEAGNQKEFTEAVRKVVSGEINLLRGEELAVKIQSNNSTKKMVEEYLEVYKQLIDGQ